MGDNNMNSPADLVALAKKLENLASTYTADILQKANANYHPRERYTEDAVRLCPICRDLPKIKYEFTGGDTWCSLSCGPWYWKKHFRCAAGVAGINFTRALMHAIAGWNERVEQYYKNHPEKHPPVSD